MNLLLMKILAMTFNPSFHEIGAGRTHSSIVVSSIDKLIAVTRDFLDFDALKKEFIRLPGDKGFVKELGEGKGKLWIKKREFDGDVKFSFNPSFFGSADAAVSAIGRELGRPGLNARITFVELANTFPSEFADFWMGIDYGKKRVVERWGFLGAGRTVYVGKVGDRFEMKVYDKQAEMHSRGVQIAHPCTRIEMLVAVDDDIRVENLWSLGEYEPFRQVTRYKFSFKKPRTKSSAKLIRYGEFRAMVRLLGHCHARKELNRECGNNFNRLYGDFYELEELKPTLDEIFQLGIRGFFQQ